VLDPPWAVSTSTAASALASRSYCVVLRRIVNHTRPAPAGLSPAPSIQEELRVVYDARAHIATALKKARPTSPSTAPCEQNISKYQSPSEQKADGAD
jgi:hypothetical protein